MRPPLGLRPPGGLMRAPQVADFCSAPWPGFTPPLTQHASRWQAVMSIAAKIGCTPQMLNDWVKKAEVASGKRAGIPTEMAEKMKALERENRELRQANEILRKASA